MSLASDGTAIKDETKPSQKYEVQHQALLSPPLEARSAPPTQGSWGLARMKRGLGTNTLAPSRH